MAALTQVEIQEIASKVKALLAQESQGVGELTIVNSLDGIRSLPALKSVGDDDTVVEAPLSLLKGDIGITPILTFAIKAVAYGTNPSVAKTGTNEAPTITISFPLAQNGDKPVWQRSANGIDIKYSRDPDSAYESLFSFADVMPDVSDFSEDGIKLLQKPALDAVVALGEWKIIVEGDVRKVIKNAEDATRDTLAAAELTDEVKQQTDRVREETDKVRQETLTVKSDTEKVKDETSGVKDETEKVRKETLKAKENTETVIKSAGEATQKAIDAADRLKDLSDHRDEIRDGYWWRWNEETGEWYNTGEIAKGNTMFATFGIDPTTGILTMSTDPEYTGANFEINNNGELTVNI